jgi:N-acetylgalactosamine-6-sulfatase
MEGGIGVPFIARWPGKISAGKVDKTSVLSAVDLLPTFCELGNVKLPRSYKPDGISQVSALMGKGNPLRKKPIFWRMSAPWPANESKPDHWVAYAVVHEQWKLVLNKDQSHAELFDLVRDPLEKKNISQEYPKIVVALQDMLGEWLTSLPVKPTGKVFSKLRGQ